MNKIIFGDCRHTMRDLIAQGVKVQMCVTSPPYFGLRDYGTAAWEGGDPDCDHVGKEARTVSGGAGKQYTNAGSNLVFSGNCACGAKRVDLQLGLEQTPAEYVANMVEVFSLVWELLADDGVLWLNLGSSYASGGMNPSQSLLQQRVPACGTNGKESQDFPVADRACHDSCDEPQGEILTRRADNAHSDLSAEQGALLPSQINRGSGHQDYVKEPLSALPDDDLASTMQQSSVQHQDAFYRPATASVSQKEVGITKHCAQASEHSSACTDGTAQMLQPLEVHTMGKESFFSACRRSSCKGIGKCGYCFASLSIASLNVKSKDELNIPHLVAMALQADGWYLRQTIIWSKPNPMPESVTDRCTKAHEYLFLLSKSERYYFDNEAIKEPSVDPDGSAARYKSKFGGKKNEALLATDQVHTRPIGMRDFDGTRNRRSVWTVATKPYNGKKTITDYVGDDGKPYTASADCLIHGHLARRQTSDTRGHDERQYQTLPRNGDTLSRPAPSPACGEKPTTSHTLPASAECSSPLRTSESNHVNKILSLQTEHTSGAGSTFCSGCSSELRALQDCGKDCSYREYVSTATPHNIETSKTAPGLATIPPCTPCAETNNGTLRTSSQPVLLVQCRGTFESNTLTSGFSSRLLQDIPTGSAGKLSELASCEPEKKCTCKEAIIDHFATFPPALIEPCILSGSRVGDVVLDPFMGSGTTAQVAIKLGRQYLGCELNPAYADLQNDRTAQDAFIF